MKREHAIAIRCRQLQGEAVAPEVLREAIATIQATNAPVSRAQEVGVRRKQGKKRVSQAPCACGNRDCEADPPAVAKAIKPWVLLTPETAPADPEHYPWPRLGVDIDAVHRRRG